MSTSAPGIRAINDRGMWARLVSTAKLVKVAGQRKAEGGPRRSPSSCCTLTLSSAINQNTRPSAILPAHSSQPHREVRLRQFRFKAQFGKRVKRNPASYQEQCTSQNACRITYSRTNAEIPPNAGIQIMVCMRTLHALKQQKRGLNWSRASGSSVWLQGRGVTDRWRRARV